jgi:hypothetical protein
VRELAHRRVLTAIIANSGQHPDAVRRTFAEFGIRCDIELPALPRRPTSARRAVT